MLHAAKTSILISMDPESEANKSVNLIYDMQNLQEKKSPPHC